MSEPEPQPKLRSKEGVRAFLVILLVAAVGIATIGLPAVYGGAATTATAAEPPANVESYESVSQAESSLGAADEVYLREDGGAVLRYDDQTDVNRLDLGADVSEGLVHMLVVDNVSDQNTEYEEASFSAVLDQSGLSGDGSLVMKQPDSLKDLSVDVSGEVSDETNQFDATASGTFESQNAPIESASTSGTVTATADRLTASGSASVDGGMSAAGGDMQMDVSLQDTGSSYVLDVSQARPVSDWSAGQWETREKAKQALQRQYGNLASELGGSSEITISNYNFEERSTGQHRLELDFTVEYTGIDSGIERQLATQLANDPTTGLSYSEASEIAATVTELEIETFEFSFDRSNGSMEAQWDIAIANYNELTLAMIDVAEASSTTSVAQEDLEKARTAIEAQQAANLESTLEWDVTVEQTSNEEVTLDATVSGDTNNWGAYVDELESRDVEPPKDVTFSMTAETNDGELELDAQFELKAEDLASQAVKSWAQSVQGSPSMSSDANQFVTALSESELEVARVDADLGDGTVRVEGGARFENMSKITNTISDNLAISGVASEMNDGTSSTYVYVDSMGDVDTASATKADIEHLGVVGSETTVHAAGEWDREFPSVDTEAMNSYLEGKSGGDEKDGDGGDSIPGFGFGAGLASVAALLTTLVLRRRT